MVDYRSLFDLQGKKAVVIGAGSGIGAASAQGLAAFGAEVICADVDLAAAEQTVSLIAASAGTNTARAYRMNITDPAAVSDALATLGTPDVVVATPAINVRKRMIDLSDDEFDRVIDLNLRGNFRILRDYGRALANGNGGSIIAFSSIRAQVVEPGQGVYAATKAGVLQLVRVLAAELGPRGVRANAIAPGIVETPLTGGIKANEDWYNAYQDKTILGRWANPSEMVGAVIFLASAASSYVTGSYLVVDGGWLAADGRYTPPT
ncbi:MAG: SDR family NAD(P)-dependent oxidoreductase [Ferrimicrobium sp.]